MACGDGVHHSSPQTTESCHWFQAGLSAHASCCCCFCCQSIGCSRCDFMVVPPAADDTPNRTTCQRYCSNQFNSGDWCTLLSCGGQYLSQCRDCSACFMHADTVLQKAQRSLRQAHVRCSCDGIFIPDITFANLYSLDQDFTTTSQCVDPSCLASAADMLLSHVASIVRHD